MSVIDVSSADVVRVDGQDVPIGLVRALATSSAVRIRVEMEDASVEDIEVRREPGTQAIHFTRQPRSGRGTDARPIEMEHRAELVLVTAEGLKREWVDRGSSREAQLVSLGWREEGRSRPRARAASTLPPAIPSNGVVAPR